ncbi:ATP-binding protein [Streptomyces sp. NPDC004270]
MPEPRHPHTREAFYRRDRRSVGVARDFTRTVLADWEVGPRADDVLLRVSELTTCSTAYPRTEVQDSGPGELRYGDMSPDSEHGRGLLLVTLVADKWGVEERDPGKIVWCEFGVPG